MTQENQTVLPEQPPSWVTCSGREKTPGALLLEALLCSLRPWPGEHLLSPGDGLSAVWGLPGSQDLRGDCVTILETSDLDSNQ